MASKQYYTEKIRTIFSAYLREINFASVNPEIKVKDFNVEVDLEPKCDGCYIYESQLRKELKDYLKDFGMFRKFEVLTHAGEVEIILK